MIAAMQLEISRSTASRDAAWDAFVAAMPGSHFEQLSGWAAVKVRYGWQVLRLLATEGGAIVGGVQVLIRRLGRWGQIGYVARGPVVRPGDRALALHLAQEVDRQARAERWLYLVFDYAYDAHELAATMAANGYRPHPEGVPPSGLLAATAIVDLTAPEPVLLERMNRGTRRSVRTATGNAFSFTEGSRADLSAFRDLMLAICARRNSTPTPPQPDYFHHLWDELHHRGWFRLFLLRLDQELVAGQAVFTASDTLRSWKVGWSGAHGKLHPNERMNWEVMRWAKARGFRGMDFVSIDPQDARAALAGAKSSADFADRSTAFKLGFGGAAVLVPPAQSRFLHPWARALDRCGALGLLHRGSVQRALSRYWGRVGRT